MTNYKNSTSTVKGYTDSKIASSEKNDCFVRALAAATDVHYDTAHTYSKEVFGRINKNFTVISLDVRRLLNLLLKITLMVHSS